jgi:hypothetical protein
MMIKPRKSQTCVFRQLFSTPCFLYNSIIFTFDIISTIKKRSTSFINHFEFLAFKILIAYHYGDLFLEQERREEGDFSLRGHRYLRLEGPDRI